MKMSAVMVALLLSAVGCATSEELSDEVTDEASDPSSDVTQPAPPGDKGQSRLICEPGPPSNWCQNRVDKACSSPGALSRCYIPSYCEWGLLQCTNGVWVLIDPS